MDRGRHADPIKNVLVIDLNIEIDGIIITFSSDDLFGEERWLGYIYG
ncbi:hypothetical protein [Flavobacterium collinsii]|jgi:hypothetical protein|uniref:Uncharacterized protein n=1 Tax=Flavobacterium collinsii TaxID=1114861 RepID=A0ABM8KCJ0_9FLAO|nr:hypothetical protein [Flavobacterium collinsii]GIQ61281.1 hypothetical protein Flavo103_44160 [Flavobacterium collinsii]CAA9194229.1 hypothetical protein FLACOL7796_00021 [Flavobacterium collinsii]